MILSSTDDGGRRIETAAYTTEDFYIYRNQSNVKYFSVCYSYEFSLSMFFLEMKSPQNTLSA